MAKDFTRIEHRHSSSRKTGRKPRANARRKPTRKTKIPAWIWGLIVLLMALLVVLSLYIAKRERAPNLRNQSADDNKNTATAPKPRFDFYEILKQRKLEVPDHSDEITAAVPDNIEFYLQVGSFRNSGDADELRAQLLLLNFEAFTELGSREGENWHRVIVGPFETRSQVAKARSILASNNIRPLLLKRNKVNQ